MVHKLDSDQSHWIQPTEQGLCHYLAVGGLHLYHSQELHACRKKWWYGQIVTEY